MRLISWNVNGLRACLDKGFEDFVRRDGADVICLQEVRALPEQVTLDLPDYGMFWNPALKRGYSGTAILSRTRPRAVFPGLGIADHDTEGRVLTAEYDDFFVVTVYTPNAQRELTRLDYRQNQWDRDFLKFVRRLEKTKPVVFCGDLNVSHREIDLANPGPNRGNAGFTDEERAGFDNILAAGFVDGRQTPVDQVHAELEVAQCVLGGRKNCLHAFGFGRKTVGELARHGQHCPTTGGQLGDELAQRLGQAVGVAPKRKRQRRRATRVVSSFQVCAADVDAPHGRLMR